MLPDIDHYRPKHVSPGCDFLLSLEPHLSRVIREYAAQPDNPSLQLELAGYQLIDHTRQTGVLEGGTIHQDQDGLILLVQDEFNQANPGFVESLLWARRQSRVGLIAADITIRSKWYGDGILDKHYHSFFSEHLPVVCVQLDDLSKAARFLRTDPGILTAGLSRTDYWKASEHLIFGSATMPGHDYPSYVDRTRGDLPLPYFLLHDAVHERLHLMVDRVTMSRYNTFHTWLNEGFANLQRGLSIPFQSLRSLESWPTPDEIMTSSDKNLKYDGGQLLLEMISHTLAERDPELEGSSDNAAFKFLSLLADNGGLTGLNGLNERTKQLVGGDDWSKINSWFASLEKSRKSVPFHTPAPNPFDIQDPINR